MGWSSRVIQAVTTERWQEAQTAEFPKNPLNPGRYELRNAALFALLEIDHDQQGKTIVEIGCGPYPVTSACVNINAILIEPLDYELEVRVKQTAEDVEFNGDEAWLFNVLQHVRDPELIVEKCKRLPVVRFFEPIDYPTSLCHPHTFTLKDFQRWFGDSTMYFDGTGWPGFHDAPCAYGVWHA